MVALNQHCYDDSHFLNWKGIENDEHKHPASISLQCDGIIYCRIRNNKNNITKELGTYPAGVVSLNDSQIDFQNDAADYVLKKGDVIWIEYDDPSAVDGNTYIMYKTGDKDNYDAINSMFVKYTSTTVPDPLSDLSAVINT